MKSHNNSNNRGNIERNNLISLNNNEQNNVIRINPQNNNIVLHNIINEVMSENYLDEEI